MGSGVADHAADLFSGPQEAIAEAFTGVAF
jgi:hypothetical protein